MVEGTPMTTGEDRLAADIAAMASVEAMLSAYLGPDEATRAANDVIAKLRLGGFVLSRNAAPSLIADAREVERLRAVERIARAIVAEADADPGMYGPEHHGIAHQFRAALEASS